MTNDEHTIVQLINTRNIFAKRLFELTTKLLNPNKKKSFKARISKKTKLKALYCKEILDIYKDHINQMGYVPDVDMDGIPIKLTDPRLSQSPLFGNT
jgi:hypothetical protein